MALYLQMYVKNFILDFLTYKFLKNEKFDIQRLLEATKLQIRMPNFAKCRKNISLRGGLKNKIQLLRRRLLTLLELQTLKLKVQTLTAGTTLFQKQQLKIT